MKFNSIVETVLNENNQTSKERSQDEMKKDFEALFDMFDGLPRTESQAKDMGWKVSKNPEDYRQIICEDPKSKDALTIEKDSYDIETFKGEDRLVFRHNDRDDSLYVPKYEIINDKPLKLLGKQDDSHETNWLKSPGDRVFHTLKYFEKGNKYREDWGTRIGWKMEYYNEYPWWLKNKEKAEKAGMNIEPITGEEEF
jgi:hypothetical protein